MSKIDYLGNITANSYIKKKAEGKLGSIEVPSAVLQIANRDSVKNTPALAGYESAMELVTKSFLANPKRIQTYNNFYCLTF